MSALVSYDLVGDNSGLRRVDLLDYRAWLVCQLSNSSVFFFFLSFCLSLVEVSSRSRPAVESNPLSTIWTARHKKPAAFVSFFAFSQAGQLPDGQGPHGADRRLRESSFSFARFLLRSLISEPRVGFVYVCFLSCLRLLPVFRISWPVPGMLYL